MYERRGREDLAAVGIVGNVYNSVSYGVAHSGMGSMHISTMLFCLEILFCGRRLPDRVILSVSIKFKKAGKSRLGINFHQLHIQQNQKVNQNIMRGRVFVNRSSLGYSRKEWFLFVT